MGVTSICLSCFLSSCPGRVCYQQSCQRCLRFLPHYLQLGFMLFTAIQHVCVQDLYATLSRFPFLLTFLSKLSSKVYYCQLKEQAERDARLMLTTKHSDSTFALLQHQDEGANMLREHK